MIYLNNLEYLNLDSNQIELIEMDSFNSLINLETLILSNNKINSLKESIFKPLNGIKFINLSSNQVQIIESGLFTRLEKLEVIDLSRNQIYLVQESSFFNLDNLQTLHLNENSPNMTIDNRGFHELNSIESIHLSKSIINSQTSLIFIDLLKQKNKNQNTKILNVNYLKSLNLISYNEIDCNLTLYFIRENVHFNLRTEYDWYRYVSNCEDDEIKIKEKVSTRKDDLIRIQFTNSWIFYLAIPTVTVSIFIFVYLLYLYVVYTKL
jgi:Leucine-rich repeat (LRR) protein